MEERGIKVFIPSWDKAEFCCPEQIYKLYQRYFVKKSLSVESRKILITNSIFESSNSAC